MASFFLPSPPLLLLLLLPPLWEVLIPLLNEISRINKHKEEQPLLLIVVSVQPMDDDLWDSMKSWRHLAKA